MSEFAAGTDREPQPVKRQLSLTEKIEASVELAQFAVEHHFPFAGKPQSIENKDDGSRVTNHDKAIEQAFISLVGSDVLGEETHQRMHRDPRQVFELAKVWIIDPIDGTSHFIRGEQGQYTSAWGEFQIRKGVMTPSFGAVLLPSRGEKGMLMLGHGETMLEIDLASGKRTRRAAERTPDSFWPLRIASAEWSVTKVVPPERMHLIDREGSSGVSVADLAAVIEGRAHLSFITANIWDVAGPIAVGRAAGCELVRLDTGEPVDGFTEADFTLDHSDDPWRIRSPLVFCRAGQYQKLKEIL